MRIGNGLTPEERFAAKAAQDYVDFIRVDPWYLFEFKNRLTQLWQLPLSGANTLRRFERRFALTCEYLVKEGYARLIKFATHSIYEAPKPVTAVVLDRLLAANQSHPEIKVLDVVGDDIIATIPRYEAFTDYGRWLAAEGVRFREIAGNRGEVVVSLLVPIGYITAQSRLSWCMLGSQASRALTSLACSTRRDWPWCSPPTIFPRLLSLPRCTTRHRLGTSPSSRPASMA